MTETPNWPASAVENVPVGALKEAAANSRVHSEEQVAQIAKSIQKFGWTIPVLIDESGTLIAGHARVRAALTLGITEVPAMRAVGWSDEQKEAYQITDNRLAENSSWDDEVLTAQIKRLNAMQFDMDVLGFDMSDFDLGEAFNPAMAPTIDTSKVTGEAVAKTKGELDNQYADGTEGKGGEYDVTCPHCGKEFEVSL